MPRDLENLLRQLGELDAFERAAGVVAPAEAAGDWRRSTAMIWLRRVVPLSAAAAFAALFGRPDPDAGREDGVWHPTRLASMTHFPFDKLLGPQRVDSFETCAKGDGYAMVLLRAWSDDCSCMAWRVHQDDDGRRILAFRTGDTVRLSIDVTENPAAEQLLIVALADGAGQLPADTEEAEKLLACLDTSAPASFPADSTAGYERALASCLPTGVQLVQQSFTVE